MDCLVSLQQQLSSFHQQYMQVVPSYLEGLILELVFLAEIYRKSIELSLQEDYNGPEMLT